MVLRCERWAPLPLEPTGYGPLVGCRATEPVSNAVQRLILRPAVAGSQRTERTRLRKTVKRRSKVRPPLTEFGVAMSFRDASRGCWAWADLGSSNTPPSAGAIGCNDLLYTFPLRPAISTLTIPIITQKLMIAQ